MPSISQPFGHSGNVLVDVVGLRPGERGHEANPEGHVVRV
jgi:hypothetical protein